MQMIILYIEGQATRSYCIHRELLIYSISYDKDIRGKESFCQGKRHSFNIWSRKISHAAEHLARTCVLNRVWLFATPWVGVRQPLLSMEFSSQEYWGGLSFPTPGDLPDSGFKPMSLESPTLQVDSLPLCHLGRGLEQLNPLLLFLC